MNHALWLAGLITLLGASLWLPFIWQQRTYLTYIYVALELLALGLFSVSGHPMLLIVFITLSAYKLINYARVLQNRMQPAYLQRMTWRSEWLLGASQLVIIVFGGLHTALGLATSLLCMSTAALLLNLVLLSSTSRHLKTTKTLQASKSYTDQELPTLSVLVPARNETDDLQACLDCLVSSSYPKLEIIVLDDCSQSKRTPEIIRSFAHAGVRFVAGQAPNDSWLAKNYAYQQLADAASGDYLLFCGVDVRMTPGAMRELITTMLEKKKSMLSVLPHNTLPTTWRTRLIQPMRYAWELSLPRRLFNRPPVLSTCWIIERSALTSAGSFKATSRSILPESYFARMTARVDGYSFLRSNMLVSNKAPIEQQATTVRMRYPQLRRRLELVWFISWLEVIGLVSPLPVAIALIALGHPVAAGLAIAATLLQIAVIVQVTAVMYGRPLLPTVMLAPLYDIALLNYSMYRYEFKTVDWKDRNICLPIMRIEP